MRVIVLAWTCSTELSVEDDPVLRLSDPSCDMVQSAWLKLKWVRVECTLYGDRLVASDMHPGEWGGVLVYELTAKLADLTLLFLVTGAGEAGGMDSDGDLLCLPPDTPDTDDTAVPGPGDDMGECPRDIDTPVAQV